MDFGLYEMKIVRNNPSSVKSDPRLTWTNDLSPLGSDLSEVYCILVIWKNKNKNNRPQKYQTYLHNKYKSIM